MTLSKLTKRFFICAGIYIVILLGGCTTFDHSLVRAQLKSANCETGLSLETAASVHAEFHQQLLPIHQRPDILDAELADARRSH